MPIFASRLDSQRRILASAVPSHSPTTEELLKRAEDLMREDCAYLKDFNAAVDQLLKRQAEFQTEHPAFGSLLLTGSLGFKRAIVALLRQKKFCSRS